MRLDRLDILSRSYDLDGLARLDRLDKVRVD
jgi:hypothetical protein